MVVLDTHAWIWWVDRPDQLSASALDAIEDAEAVGVATISCWEVAMLATKRRIELDRDIGTWIRQALAQPGVAVLQLDPKAAVDAALLPAEFAGDPADRLIYATARDRGASLVTRDERIRAFDPRATIW
jgi:PIN domain nuclease of toxin-antitoxin system